MSESAAESVAREPHRKATPNEPTDSTNPTMPRTVGVLIFGGVLVLSALRYAPPASEPADAPPEEFSAGRALQLLESLVGNGRPHPVGSVANEAVCEQICAELRRLLYEPEVQEFRVRSAQGEQSAGRNILARRTGTRRGKAIMLACHYDSVPAGPGAGDDGASVAAVLEIARIVREGPHPRHDILFLLTDGEERGLLGSDAFVRAHAAAKDVGVVINLEARGTSGPSLMFETSPGNRRLIQVFAGATRRPVTSSLFYEVYRRLPNDTDFTVFRGAGMAGYNFAFIGDATNYHTAQDNIANLDPRSVQHHGDNALELLRALDAADWETGPAGDAVYFDLFGLVTVWWPATATIPAVALIAACFVLSLVRMLRRRAIAALAVLWGFASWLALVTVPALVAFGIDRLPTATYPTRSPEYRWPPDAVRVILWWWGLAAVTAWIVARSLGRRAGGWGFWWGVWLGWLALAALVGSVLPAASYALVVPAAVATVSSLIFAFCSGRHVRRYQLLASAAPALAAACIWLPAEWLFYDAIGVAVKPLIALRASMVFSAFLPLAVRFQPTTGITRPSATESAA